MTRTLWALGVVIACAMQDGACPRYNRCTERTSRKKVSCGECDKKKKYSEDRLCTTCGRKNKVCYRCGLPRKSGRSTGRKPRLKVVDWFTWTWSFEDDLSDEDFEAKKKVVQRWQQMLWKAGEGNFSLKQVTIVDKSKKVEIMHTPKSLKDARMLSKSIYARVLYRPIPHMELPGRCDPFTWLHELGHLLFRCPEEYDSPNGCPCVESTGRKGGKMQWCDKSNHSEEQAKQHGPCWESYILKKYPNAKHPGPGGEMPEVKIVVRNN